MKRERLNGLLPRVLRALADGENIDDAATTDIGSVEWLVHGGLGPLLYRLRPTAGFQSAPGADALLHGAELTSRVLTADLIAAVEDIIIALHSAGTEPTLLKGISFASRYYEEPHLRIMGDVDILVPPDSIDRSIEAVRHLGFETIQDAGHSLHHAPPLRQPGRDIHLELHHALLPPTSAAAAEAPLHNASINGERVVGRFTSTTTGYLTPECELMLIAAGWCRDLAGRLGLRGTPRPLADVVALVRSCGDALDWDRIERWSHGSFNGACAAVVLTYLASIGAWRGPAGLPARLARAQPFVNRASLRVIHAIFDRHVLRHARPGRVLSPNVLENVLDSLLSARPAWRNLAHVPVNTAFPRREPRRFRPGFVLRRMGAPFRAR
jgi:hypothetical protein